jgi:hypothetical protein
LEIKVIAGPFLPEVSWRELRALAKGKKRPVSKEISSRSLLRIGGSNRLNQSVWLTLRWIICVQDSQLWCCHLPKVAKTSR